MSLSTSALITAEQVYAFLSWGAGTHGEDLPLVEAAIEAMSKVVRRKTNCTIGATVGSYAAEKVDGTGRLYLYLKHWPVLTLASVYEDDVLLVENTDFYQVDAGDADRNRGILERAGDIWTKTQRGIAATYTAGYTAGIASPTLPNDLGMACIVQTIEFWKRAKQQSWGETSRTVGQQTISYSDKDLVPMVAEILKAYWRDEF